MSSKVSRCALVALVIVFPGLAACASTTTKKIGLAPAEIELEEAKQRHIVLATQLEQQQRLSNIAFPILEAATPLCQDDTRKVAGFLFANAHEYQKEWRVAARTALGLGEALRVTTVAAGSPADNAGIQPGDVLLRMNSDPVPVGPDAVKKLGKELDEIGSGGDQSLDLWLERDGERLELDLTLVDACYFPAFVHPSSTLNAFADGQRIWVTASMMRFVDDQELAVIVSHELAHNAMDHIDAKKKNALLGAVLGALVDVAASLGSGYSTGGAYASEGAEIGASAHSQDFETEADYVGLYALALAGIELEGVARLWRHMAQANPDHIGFAYTHPTTVERFLRLERTIEEIERKRLEALPLRPDPKASDSRQGS